MSMSETHGLNRERLRLDETRDGGRNWRRWGTYLAERQWGTVREDYSDNGDAWSAFPHEHARSRAYRWGEDGLLGLSDDRSLLCFSFALWNGQDRILKERLFGVTNPEGNHGEDVKEHYYYLDGLPSAAYMRGLYKYPQQAFPYQNLLDENRRRGKLEPEYDLIDTGIFDEHRYFDVFIEYAKNSPNDMCILLTLANRGPKEALLHVLPTLWFRNTWSWEGGYEQKFGRPSLRRLDANRVLAEHSSLGRYTLTASTQPDGKPPVWLFTENETNTAQLYGDTHGPRHAKDAFHRYVIDNEQGVVRGDGQGTKTAAWYTLNIGAGDSVQLRLRLTAEDQAGSDPLGRKHAEVMTDRRREAEEFYQGIALPADQATVRQAAAGLIWSKQFYYYSVRDWLSGDPIFPPPEGHRHGRNADWRHVFARDVISMPDKWEFPWFAAWDLAFHMVPFSLIDPAFARDQLLLMLREWYMQPNGQLAAYEYNFSDVNPPVHAWACMHLYKRGEHESTPDADFLKRVFHKLLLNFTWWVNRKDASGRNLFGGGFLGLDNIGVFDRSLPLPEGVSLEQADGTAWMGLYCCSMLSMSLALAEQDRAYEDIAVKFLEHFASIMTAINTRDGTGLWDDVDGFYYDHVTTGNESIPLRVRSLVGLLPLVGALDSEAVLQERMPEFSKRVRWAIENKPGMRECIQTRDTTDTQGRPVRKLLIALPTRERLVRMLRVMLDENEFLSPHGIRSVSKFHLEHPFVFHARGQRMEVNYQPGESDSYMFGGNSNWRGPVWFPINVLLIESLFTYHRFYGDSLQVEFPTGSGHAMDLRQVALKLSERLVSIFRPGVNGARPVHGTQQRYADDPHWRDLILFNEYFHGDNGRGCGANHQTGWTALVISAAHVLQLSKEGRV
ncbi:MAG: hypothetical protein RL701_4144 [Pseudomonadota bacterium]